MAQESSDTTTNKQVTTTTEDAGALQAALVSASASAPATPFKFNVHAPEFVPMSPAAASPLASPMSAPAAAAGGYYSPFMQVQPGLGVAPDWSFFHDHEPVFFMPDFAHAKFGAAAAAASAGAAGSNSAQAKGTGAGTGTGAATDVAHKIVKQVEYQFSDINLVANEFLLKIMNKDTEGYVPLSVIASWKKIKSLGATNQMLVKALRTSTKLIVSDDGKKVRRRQPFTEKHKEELQSRMIIAENLPEDSSRNSLEKIFGVVGSVKNIKICHPQEPSTARASKSDTLVSNKMHALVEYETSQQAEKAVEKLNDERNWRKGLRVRTVLRRSPKSVMRLKRPDFDHFVGSDDDSPHSQMSSESPTADHSPDAHQEDHQNGNKKGWARGRGKLHLTAPHSPQSAPAGMVSHFDPSSPRPSSQKCPSSPRQASQKCPFSPRQPPQGPRMPDGTRGFTMGRGKPASSSPATRAVSAPTPAPQFEHFAHLPKFEVHIVLVSIEKPLLLDLRETGLLHPALLLCLSFHGRWRLFDLALGSLWLHWNGWYLGVKIQRWQLLPPPLCVARCDPRLRLRDEEGGILTLEFIGLPSDRPGLVGTGNIPRHILVQSKLSRDTVREVLLDAIQAHELTRAQAVRQQPQVAVAGEIGAGNPAAVLAE
ncbi:hypothetical protein U9M48_011319 [Paspalum notatum var. saurae]|uniref:La-related protein 6C n=1 Tax=Paspalum notatum var. saurae TaxID=547442 RepID=A0AAQ3WHG5_PASNO